MIQSIVSACLRGRFAVVALSVLLLGFGIDAARRSSIDAFPEFAPPLVEVQTEAPGFSSLDVETLVTTPIENLLSGVSFVQTVRSKSVLGLSSVVVIFENGTDLFIARQLLQERLARAPALLPRTVLAPAMLAPVSSTGRVLKVGFTSSTLSQVEITDLVRFTLLPRLLAVPGIAHVGIWGARDRQYDVALDPIRLEANQSTENEVRSALTTSTSPMPGGFVDGPLQRLSLQHQQVVASPNDLANLPIATRGGATLRVGDIARVVDGFAPPIGDAVVNDRPGLLLIVQKQPWGNTLEITRRIDEVLRRITPAMPGVEIDNQIFRPAAFIERSIANLEEAMVLGCALVIFILALFLWNWRTALISALAIPLSLAAALLVLRFMGGTLNTMVLAGLVIALGEVVDDAIIDVENILRRLRENKKLENPRSSFSVVLDASVEVRSAVVYATLVVLLVFAPMLFLRGVSGSFFRPLAMAYALGVLASMVVAIVITPALSLLLLPKTLDSHRESPVSKWAQNHYRSILEWTLNRPKRVIAAGIVSLLIGAFGFSFLHDEFLPEFRENDFLMHWVGQPGTSLPALSRTAQLVSRDLRAIPGVTSFGAHLGRAEGGDEIVGPNFGELWIHVDPNANHEEISHRVLTVLERYPGVRRDLETYLREKIGEVLSGTQGAIVVRIFGPDLDVLRQSANAMALRLREIPGIRSVQVEQQASVPEIRAEVRSEASAIGFLPGDVRNAVNLRVRGERVGEVIDRARSIPIVLRGRDEVREDITALRDDRVTSLAGTRARLGDVASLTIGPSPNAIFHEGASRRIDISLQVQGDLGSTSRAVERVIAEMQLPPAHHAEVLGEWKERLSAFGRLLGYSLVSLMLILVVLYADLQSVRKTLMVAASLPFALVGGVMGAWLSGGVLSLGSLVGLVTVLGVASRNGILLISHYRYLEDQHPQSIDRNLLVQGSLERVSPILMTALATSLALVPLVVRGNLPGHEIEHPMAVVILGGLLSSTALSLLVMPTLYLRFGISKALS